MKRIIGMLIMLVSISSCKNYVPYTDALRQKNNWGEEQLKKIQFYTSDPIVIQRKIEEGNTEIISGKIKTINGEKVEEIIIPARTPGVLVKQDDKGKFSISFEQNDEHYLRFGDNPNRNGYYALLASEWRNKIGKLTYNGKQYMASPESSDAVLMVDLHKIQKSELNQRVAKGRKVQ